MSFVDNVIINKIIYLQILNLLKGDVGMGSCVCKTLHDCGDCGKYFSITESYYSNYYKKRCKDITCCLSADSVITVSVEDDDFGERLC